MKAVSVVGACPQFIKCDSVSYGLRQVAQEVLVYTGQHYDDSTSGVFLCELGLPEPDFHLAVGSKFSWTPDWCGLSTRSARLRWVKRRNGQVGEETVKNGSNMLHRVHQFGARIRYCCPQDLSQSGNFPPSNGGLFFSLVVAYRTTCEDICRGATTQAYKSLS